MTARVVPAWFVTALLAVVPIGAPAAEFRSVGENAAILYDAPSARATKLYVIGRSYPVEIIVVLDGWTKIRDVAGELAWIETKSLSERRTVVVKARRADIRQAADDKAPLVFQAEQNVLLDLNELTGSGWARVTHRDGQSGYLRLGQVWGV
jgi:SH3-like domain-containing protein